MSKKTNHSDGDKPAVPSNPLLASATFRTRLAASFYKAVSEEENGTVASAARELGIEAKDYIVEIHWPILAAKRCFALADAFIAHADKANTRITETGKG